LPVAWATLSIGVWHRLSDALAYDCRRCHRLTGRGRGKSAGRAGSTGSHRSSSVISASGAAAAAAAAADLLADDAARQARAALANASAAAAAAPAAGDGSVRVAIDGIQ
jgi:hypothetical protein